MGVVRVNGQGHSYCKPFKCDFPVRCYASAVFAVVACPSVRPSRVGVVSKWLNIGSRKWRRTIARDSVFMMQQISTNLRKMPVSVGWVKMAFFVRSRSLRLRRLTAENLCPSATVVCIHDGALAEEYAVSSTALLVVESDNHSYGPVDINN